MPCGMGRGAGGARYPGRRDRELANFAIRATLISLRVVLSEPARRPLGSITSHADYKNETLKCFPILRTRTYFHFRALAARCRCPKHVRVRTYVNSRRKIPIFTSSRMHATRNYQLGTHVCMRVIGGVYIRCKTHQYTETVAANGNTKFKVR